ncbi:MAG: sulfotransferase [Bacteroidales bacterium]|nr:sulfotransferase [Bacteroidales bacterium]
MNKEEQKSIPFFFIIGRPRSGTTLLRTLFDAHPNVIIPLESQIIKLLFEKYGKRKSWDESQLRTLLEDVKKEWKFDTWNVDEERLEKDILDCVGETPLKQIIRAIYRNYISHFEKKEILLFGDKNPEYSLYFNKLIKNFPEAKYIHLTRDYRDQILSYMKFDFSYPIIPLIAYRWKKSVQKVLKVQKKNTVSLFSVRYEDLVETPAKCIEEMCSFLGIDFDPSILDFHKSEWENLGTKAQQELKQRYHKNLFRPIDKKSVGQWKVKMKPKDVKVADMIVGKYAKTCGYSREYKKFYPILYLRIFPLLLSRRASRILNMIIDKLPYDLKMKIRNKGSIILALYKKSGSSKQQNN